MRNLLVEASEVELVLNIVLVHLAEELVAAQAAEPGDPTHFLGTGHLALGRRIGGQGEQRGGEEEDTLPHRHARTTHALLQAYHSQGLEYWEKLQKLGFFSSTM